MLAAWLGDINPNESRVYLEAQGIPNFYTPENAVEAFSFVRDYRRNQAQLLEIPSATASSVDWKPDLSAARSIRDAALSQGRELLAESEAKSLLAAFGLPVSRTVLAATREAAIQAAQDIGFPVVIKIHSRDVTHKSDVGGVRLDLQNASMVGSAFDEMMRNVRAMRPDARVEGVAVQPMLRYAHAREVLVGVSTDAVFGPVISFGSGGVSVEAVRDTAVALPPLDGALAHELMERTRVHRLLAGYRDVPAANLDALAAVLCGVSRMVCALPWLKEMDLNPVLAHPGGAMIADARVAMFVKPPREGPRYSHMAIHPYPVELESEAVLRDGTRVAIRPIRPEDVELETRFFDRLSERSRYQRFMHYLPHLPPKMLARFTQLDYDRELALVGLLDQEFVAVGRYAPNSDGDTAEFALVVADAWQGKGLGRLLLEKLREEARKAGYRALYGNIMAANHDMLDLALHLGFELQSREGADVTVVSRLS